MYNVRHKAFDQMTIKSILYIPAKEIPHFSIVTGLHFLHSSALQGPGWEDQLMQTLLFIISASLLQALEKQQEALLHFREAVKLAPCNFEAQKGT